MNYYIRIGLAGERLGTWKISEDEALRLDVSNALSGPGTHFKAQQGETIWEVIEQYAGDWIDPATHKNFYKLDLEPGTYYPRMARPLKLTSPHFPGFNHGAAYLADTIAMAQTQISVLTRQLEHICQTIHPCSQNWDAYGHDIRNLLILTCTEVENHWRGVLRANGSSKTKFTTQDYIKLCSPMKLDEYSIKFPKYPWLGEITPFKNWDGQSPTKSIPWYDAYNAVKHDRDTRFSEGTLGNIFQALSACYIMIVSQFGIIVDSTTSNDIKLFYHVFCNPTWSPSDCYSEALPYNGGVIKAINYPF